MGSVDIRLTYLTKKILDKFAPAAFGWQKLEKMVIPFFTISGISRNFQEEISRNYHFHFLPEKLEIFGNPIFFQKNRKF
jgi:hypothetical protein